MRKIDNELAYALMLNEDERFRTVDLSTGYNSTDNVWELIVKHQPELSTDELNKVSGVISALFLSAQYMLVYVKENAIETLEDIPQIIYIGKANRVFYEITNARAASCINEVQTVGGTQSSLGSLDLSGEGTIVAVIDSGIDYSHPAFLDENGQSRIIGIWDQSDVWNEENTQEFVSVTGQEPGPAKGFNIGIFYPKSWIDYVLSQPVIQRNILLPQSDPSGHGTAVTGIAAGSGTVGSTLRGVAYKAQILFVKLDQTISQAESVTTRLMQALSWVTNFANEMAVPVAVNLSYGNNNGPHNGRSLLETFIDDIADVGNNNVVIGTGNEGATALHFASVVKNGSTVTAEFSIAPTQQTLNIQLWKNYFDVINVYIVLPDARRVQVADGTFYGSEPIKFSISYLGMSIVVFNNAPTPYNIMEEIRFEFIRNEGQTFLPAGRYEIVMEGMEVKSGLVNMWMPSGSVAAPQTRFLTPDPDTTLTIPSTSFRAIGVAAYDSATDVAADYSGRGFLTNGLIKPEIAAPGTNIVAPSPQGSYSINTGTSFATPFVTGSVALLMEWGIVRENDVDLYGQKLKSFLIRGARKLPGVGEVPRVDIGWGSLCIRDSLPI